MLLVIIKSQNAHLKLYWEGIKMKSIFKKIGYWVAFPFVFAAFLTKLALESMGIMVSEEDEEKDDY